MEDKSLKEYIVDTSKKQLETDLFDVRVEISDVSKSLAKNREKLFAIQKKAHEKCFELAPKDYIEIYGRDYQFVDDDNTYTQFQPRINFLGRYYYLYDGHLEDDLASFPNVYDLIISYIEQTNAVNIPNHLRVLINDYKRDKKVFTKKHFEDYYSKRLSEEQDKSLTYRKNLDYYKRELNTVKTELESLLKINDSWINRTFRKSKLERRKFLESRVDYLNKMIYDTENLIDVQYDKIRSGEYKSEVESEFNSQLQKFGTFADWICKMDKIIDKITLEYGENYNKEIIELQAHLEDLKAKEIDIKTQLEKVEPTRNY